MTLIALPVFHDDLAPRFCYADHVLVVEVNAGAVLTTRTIPMRTTSGSERLDILSALGVSELLCGGFNREFLPRAAAVGIRVHWGLAGDAMEVVEAFCRGDVEVHRIRATGPVDGDNGGRRAIRKDHP